MTEDIEIKENNQEATVNTIRVKALHARTLFPRSGVFENGNNWGIVSWVVQEVEEGDPKENAYGEITVVGNYTNGIDTSKAYTIIGEEVDNPQYGKQYELKYYSEEADFTREANQREILKELVPINVLPHILKLDNPLEAIINHDTKTLTKVKGIGQTSVYRIYQKYEDKKDYLKAYIALSPYGLTPNFVMKTVNTYKNPDKAIWTVKHKPYDLIKDMSGVGFLKADEVALKIGIKKSDKERIKAFILWYLREEVENGNSWVLAKELNYALYNTLGGPNEIIEYYDKEDKTKNNINQSIQELDDAHLIHIEDNEDKAQRRVYLMRYWNLERKIAYHLKRLQSAHNNFSYSNFEEKIRRAEEKQGFEFTQEQKDGIKLGLDNQVCLIAGLGGSGKSSLVTGILAVLSQYDFAQCALSGKASARLQEVTGKDGMTIHRLLMWDPESGGFYYNKDNPLPYDIIILDEVSLVGGEIFLRLVEAIKTGAKFYMLGDPGQLEAVGTLNIAFDLLDSCEIPSVELKEVHRQAKKSGILTTAYDVRNQIQVTSNPNFEGIIKRGENEDMILDITDNREDNKNIVLEYYEDLLSSELVKDDVNNIEVISPVRERGDCSVFNLNKELQDIANPWYPGMPVMKIYKKNTEGGKEASFDIRINDKVMCVKNNYKLESPGGTPTYIFNGWTGTVSDIQDDYIIVYFPLAETKYVVIPKGKVKTHIELGYACTCHKYQGDQSPVIIGVIDYSTPPQMLTSQLVYTLLTRAKKKCVLVAQNRALQKAISTDYVSHKRTFLPEMLKFDKDKLEDMGYGKQEWNDSEDDEDEDNESEEENEIDNGSIFD